MIVNRAQEENKLRILIHSYCEAMDSQDWDKVRACFATDAVIKHGSFSGPANRFIEFAINIVSQTESCTHLVDSVDIHFEDDIALRNTHFSSRQIISGLHEKLGPVVTHGLDTEWLVKGRYLDKLMHINGTWKIIERQGYNDQTEINPLQRPPSES